MPDKRQTIRDAFLKATFGFLGYIAHCDEPVNRDEVNRLKVHMKKMHLSEDEQRSALQLFKAGTAPDFDARQALQEFHKATTPKLLQIFLMHLLTMARADRYLVEKELHAIQWVARELGYKSITFNHLLKMIYAQDQLALSGAPAKTSQPHTYNASGRYNTQESHSSNTYNSAQAQSTHHKEPPKTNGHNQSATNNRSKELHKAYKILGVTGDMTEDEIRLAYKKLASQLHPDKLMSQGLAADHIHSATERFKRVQVAYAFIKRYRSLYAAG